MMTTKKIRFVTDSTCDLPPEILARYPIDVLPCYINYNNESLADDGVALIREDFYHKMAGMRPPYPTTSAMAPGMAEEVITRAAAQADHVFIISVASTLSGVYNVMRLGASKLPPEKYTLIDSQTTTMGLGFQVWAGAEVAAETGDIDRTREAILRAREHQHVYAALETLEYLRRSGRVGWAAAGIGTMLQIKPLLYVHDGEAASVARVRTFTRVVDELVTRIRKHQPFDKLVLLYAGEEEAVHVLRERLGDIMPDQVWTIRITPVIGVHIGPKSVGAVALSSAWRT
jgi:DegV family protein with EDD domain